MGISGLPDIDSGIICKFPILYVYLLMCYLQLRNITIKITNDLIVMGLGLWPSTEYYVKY